MDVVISGFVKGLRVVFPKKGNAKDEEDTVVPGDEFSWTEMKNL